MASDDLTALLSHLQSKSQCSYLSDLHNPFCAAALARAVRQTRLGSFTPEAWRDAARYMTGRDVEAGSPEETVARLLDRLESK